MNRGKRSWRGISRRAPRNTPAGIMVCVVASASLLAGCGAAPEPTFSPSEAATRLAAIPTAANVDPSAGPTDTAAPTHAAAQPTPISTAAPTAEPTAMPVSGDYAQYTVKAGDTLSTIAFNFKISMAAIQLANQLGDSQVVQVGQTLNIPQTKMFPDENVLWMVVVVQPGDTLSDICQRYGTSLEDTVRVNKLGSAGNIRAGQELIMPIRAAETYNTAAGTEDAQAMSAVLVADTTPTEGTGPLPTPVAYQAVVVAQTNPPVDAPVAAPANSNATDLSALTPVQVEPTDAPKVVDVVPIVPLVAEATLQPTLIPDAPATPIPAVEVVAQAPVQAPVQAPAVVDAAGASVASVVDTVADRAPAAMPGVELVDPNANANNPYAGDVEFMRMQILMLYNQARIAQGLAPLNMSPTLQLAAQLHAQDCSSRGYGSHAGSDGSSSQLRIQRAGFVGKFSGENWAWGRTAEEVFDMWFTREYPSGPHRDNILGVHYTDVGFGIVPSQGGYYFIADFGAA